MATAPTSYGYPGSVNAAVHSDWITRAAAARFSVVEKDDWKVTAQPGLDRGIRINAGTGIGDSVMVAFPDFDTRSLPAVNSGSQWFLIAARRNWTSPYTTNFVVIPGNATKALPNTGVSNTPGQQSDQPIALVRCTAGQTVVQEIVDLRAWAGNGGVQAVDLMGRDTLARPGAQVKVGSSLHCYEYDAANGGSFAWKVYPLQEKPLLMRVVASNGLSNSNSEVDTNFPAFPNGVSSVIFTDRTYGAGPMKLYKNVDLRNGRVRWRLYNADNGFREPNAGYTVDITLFGY